MRAAAAAVAMIAAAACWPAGPAQAQAGPGGPPAVGVVKAQRQEITETNDFVGRVQAVDRVDLVARVTAFIEERSFTEGAEVNKGDLLYRLERGPFEADVQAKTAAVAQTRALLRNAAITLGRANSLLSTPAGQRSTVDDAQAQQASQAAQVAAGEAQLRASQISLAYTEIRAPVAGKISRTALTVGNVVTPSSGPLATIVSQDPMYVLFPVSVRTALELRARYASKGGIEAVKVKLQLADGSTYAQIGKLDYIDPTVSTNTDTLTFRAVVPNPQRPGSKPGEPGNRELVDGEFVTALVEGVEPLQVLGVPRAAVLEDQQGSYVWVVGDGNKVEQRRVQLGQSTLTVAVVSSGLKEGDTVVSEGVQRVHAGVVVAPSPASGGPSVQAGN